MWLGRLLIVSHTRPQNGRRGVSGLSSFLEAPWWNLPPSSFRLLTELSSFWLQVWGLHFFAGWQLETPLSSLRVSTFLPWGPHHIQSSKDSLNLPAHHIFLTSFLSATFKRCAWLDQAHPDNLPLPCEWQIIIVTCSTHNQRGEGYTKVSALGGHS